jgi:hypothetical protein
VLKRFYRLERSRRTPGNGLGLSLVAAVARMHGAQIKMLDQTPGLEFRLLFPRATPRAGEPIGAKINTDFQPAYRRGDRDAGGSPFIIGRDRSRSPA